MSVDAVRTHRAHYIETKYVVLVNVLLCDIDVGTGRKIKICIIRFKTIRRSESHHHVCGHTCSWDFSPLVGTPNMLKGGTTLKFHRTACTVWRQYSVNVSKRAEFDKYCLDQVKSHDHSGYLGGLLLPKEYRGVYYALHAYNIEIATIRDNIPRNSIQAGRIRFQFWRDTLQHIYGAQGLPATNNQPVVQAIDFYVRKYNLTSRWFERALEAR